jgi:hypothetical protein
LLFDALKIENVAAARDAFQFNKRAQLFVGSHNKAPSVISVCVNNPDRSPVGINR